TAAVAALRNFFVAGSRSAGVPVPRPPAPPRTPADPSAVFLTDPGRLRQDARFAAIRDRGDFQDLIARAAAFRRAAVPAAATNATVEETLPARQEMLTTLEALIGPAAPDRPTRQALAHARQELGKAYLDAGQVEEARASIQEALAARRKLVEE